jgi:hypothetical protein
VVLAQLRRQLLLLLLKILLLALLLLQRAVVVGVVRLAARIVNVGVREKKRLQ